MPTVNGTGWPTAGSRRPERCCVVGGSVGDGACRTVSPPPNSHDRRGNVRNWYPLVRTADLTAPAARFARSARYVQPVWTFLGHHAMDGFPDRHSARKLKRGPPTGLAPTGRALSDATSVWGSGAYVRCRCRQVGLRLLAVKRREGATWEKCPKKCRRRHATGQFASPLRASRCADRGDKEIRFEGRRAGVGCCGSWTAKSEMPDCML